MTYLITFHEIFSTTLWNFWSKFKFEGFENYYEVILVLRLGILARILMFSNAAHKLNCLKILRNNVGQMLKYDSIRLENPKYNLNIPIPLYFKLAIQKMIPTQILGKEHFEIDIEVPAEHDSLEGKWRVKERKKVYLYHYTYSEIENFAVLITEEGACLLYTSPSPRDRG